MSVVQVSVDVDATPEEVWAVVADPRNLPLWDHHITRVLDVPEDGIGAGTQYRVQVRFVGARASAVATVDELRKPAYAKVRVRGVIDADVQTWLEPLDGGRTRLKHRVDYRFRGGVLGELAARAVTAFGAPALLKRGILAQKHQVEGG